MQLLKYKLGELLDVSRGASLSGEFYSSEGELIRLTLGHFDYQMVVSRKIPRKIISILLDRSKVSLFSMRGI